jgi:hypothetical protein
MGLSDPMGKSLSTTRPLGQESPHGRRRVVREGSTNESVEKVDRVGPGHANPQEIPISNRIDGGSERRSQGHIVPGVVNDLEDGAQISHQRFFEESRTVSQVGGDALAPESFDKEGSPNATPEEDGDTTPICLTVLPFEDRIPGETSNSTRHPTRLEIGVIDGALEESVLFYLRRDLNEVDLDPRTLRRTVRGILNLQPGLEGLLRVVGSNRRRVEEPTEEMVDEVENVRMAAVVFCKKDRDGLLGRFTRSIGRRFECRGGG